MRKADIIKLDDARRHMTVKNKKMPNISCDYVEKSVMISNIKKNIKKTLLSMHQNYLEELNNNIG